ncbi:rna exonuclease, partial [Coemansia thaxteri]
MSDKKAAKGEDKVLVWIDCEMTGLDYDRDTILEVACAVTDGSLTTLSTSKRFVVHHPRHVLDAMGEWCTEHHGKSGLTEEVLQSQWTMAQVETELLYLVKSFSPKPRTALLAGNSVHADREFLRRHMPDLINHLHYRIIDVSTIKELALSWNPDIMQRAPTKNLAHRAHDDILESIEELRFYRDNFFLTSESEAAPLAKHRLVAARPPPPLVWIDVETTGLVAEKDIILEVAMLVTDGELNELSPAQSLVIGYPPDTVQSKLNAWSLKSHTKSGLLGDVAQSQLTLEMAEKILLAGVVEHCPKANRAILAGNNVGFDRKFIEQHMPVLAGHLHFRNLDVSS